MFRSAFRWSLAHLLLLQIAVLQVMPGAATSNEAEDYCRFSQQHTMCKTTNIGPACGGTIFARGVSEADASAIVSAHNTFREKVALGKETRGAPGPQPQASNMMEMTWDDELAMIAQRHADQCVFQHECSQCRSVERFTVGQNLYMLFQSNFDQSTNWDNAIKAWYYEVDEVPAEWAANYRFTMSTGHYTQLVWGSTYKVGCGFTMYREGAWYKKLYTCNYGPAGNYIGAPMYQSGPPCSRCPVGTYCSNAYPGLCGLEDVQQTTLVTPFLNNTSSPTPAQPGPTGTQCCPCP